MFHNVVLHRHPVSLLDRNLKYLDSFSMTKYGKFACVFTTDRARKVTPLSYLDVLLMTTEKTISCCIISMEAIGVILKE